MKNYLVTENEDNNEWPIDLSDFYFYWSSLPVSLIFILMLKLSFYLSSTKEQECMIC